MAKRQSWNTEQDKVIVQLISNYETENKKIKWAEISILLRAKNPQWSRTGKQCRQRWLNHLRPTLPKSEEMDLIDLQQLFDLIRLHGKKWSLIAKELPGRTDNSIKNFFYAALRKGLRNLNLYNIELRSQRIYKCYKQDLIDKLLSVHDEKKNKDLYISDSSVYQLAENIRQNFIVCSRDQLKSFAHLPTELEIFYELLNQRVMQFCRICKFKKSKNRRCGEEGDRFEIFTRKLNKNTSGLKKEHDEYNSVSTEEIQIKIQECNSNENYKMVKQENVGQDKMVEEVELAYLPTVSSHEQFQIQKQVELSLLMDQGNQGHLKNLFDVLSLPIDSNFNEISLFY